jgi:hypothetical protein
MGKYHLAEHDERRHHQRQRPEQDLGNSKKNQPGATVR